MYSKIKFLNSTIVLIIVLFISSATNAEEKSKDFRSLKKAAINCNVGAFYDYMPPDTLKQVVEFEKDQQKFTHTIDSILSKSKQMFGEGVKRTERGIKIPIQGTDQRWAEIFGPQWSSFVNNSANGPFYFSIDAVLKWEQECAVLHTFQACLEDQTFCSEYHIKGSVIRMKNINNSWMLVFDLAPEKQEQSRLVKKSLFDLLTWVDNYLTLHKDSPIDENFKINFAKDYITKMKQLWLELQNSSG